MSTTYNVRAGDTVTIISRRVYGVGTESQRIVNANPGISQPLQAGAVLVIPVIPGAPADAISIGDDVNPDEVAILIDGRRFRFWSAAAIKLSFDAFDTVQFVSPFDPEDKNFREIMRPFSYKSVVFTIGGVPLFTGTMVGVSPSLSPDSRTVSVTGYSLPGVLGDCTQPAGDVREFNSLTLAEITASVCAPFGIGTNFNAGAGTSFERVACGRTKNIWRFLIDLARQRNGVFGSTARGDLEFRRSSEATNPVGNLVQGVSPLITVTPIFNPQEYYSHITGFESISPGVAGSKFTVNNTHLQAAIRPKSFSVNDAVGADVRAATEAKVGRMFGNMAAYTVVVESWRDPSGKLWAPDSTVTVLAPGSMIYTPYSFKIRSVTFNVDGDARTATLELILPGAFSGKIPETLPWDS